MNIKRIIESFYFQKCKIAISDWFFLLGDGISGIIIIFFKITVIIFVVVPDCYCSVHDLHTLVVVPDHHILEEDHLAKVQIQVLLLHEFLNPLQDPQQCSMWVWNLKKNYDINLRSLFSRVGLFFFENF